MAHIADCLVDPSPSSSGLHNYISRELSPPRTISHEPIPEEPLSEEQEGERYVWRMQQPAKYQLFPSTDKVSINTTLDLLGSDGDTSIMSGSSLIDRSLINASNMRMKLKEQSLIRRRKASVPEIGPMTTVHEVAMDSPTIPGRPPLHERSISAPGHHHWRENAFGDAISSSPRGVTIDERGEIVVDLQARARSTSPRVPMSPKNLAPLVIPSSSSSQAHRIIHKQMSVDKLRLGSDPAPDVPPKSARMTEDRTSPYSQSRTPYTPYTPLTTSSSVPTSATTATPISGLEGRSSPLPSSLPSSLPNRGASPMGHSRGQSESPVYRMGHRREESENSILNRGRPKKRSDSNPMKRSLSKREAERKAFETLPQGIKAVEASSRYDMTEIHSLKKQAVGQAARFEVLDSKNVEQLSKELRALDERCEYLRKTHRSLRAGRRNLHERICTYLRSPRVARFSHESLLKQEEALSELDRSIDDWVTKLEQAENRRTRVRQKLLEHVAAALTMQSPTGSGAHVTQVGQGETLALQRAMADNTPPRSPTKTTSSPTFSPPRLAFPVASTPASATSPEDNYSVGRPSAESIRIYADSDVYALLADVENEINRMGEEKNSATTPDSTLELLRSVTFNDSSRSVTPTMQRVAESV